ncbi:hypothetical protein [Novipirellula aureliae]|nr:hypothetical protein [Novipirellula aureliae]
MQRPTNLERLSGLTTVMSMAILTIFATGCTSFNLPGIHLPGAGTSPDGTKYVSNSTGADYKGFDETMTETVYQRVREAAANNAIVLQVDGNREESRVLPLPADGRSVFVSSLLTQSGVVEEIGGVKVVLYRSSPQTIGGVKLDVKMSEGGKTVLPESDYALHPGDRIFVAKKPIVLMDGLLTSALGL